MEQLKVTNRPRGTKTRAQSQQLFGEAGLAEKRRYPMANDIMPFFRAWLRDPFRVGAAVPSSQALAAVMTAEITPALGPIIELGAGSGVFTRALLARGVPEEQITLIESGGDFATLLSARFPAARVLRMDASSLHLLDCSDGERAGAVVSGLPLLSMSMRKLVAILEGAFHHLRPDGALYQFTYGPTCPIPRRLLDRLGLEATRIGGTFANFPPATVYCIRRLGVRRRTPPPDTFGAALRALALRFGVGRSVKQNQDVGALL